MGRRFIIVDHQHGDSFFHVINDEFNISFTSLNACIIIRGRIGEWKDMQPSCSIDKMRINGMKIYSFRGKKPHCLYIVNGLLYHLFKPRRGFHIEKKFDHHHGGILTRLLVEPPITKQSPTTYSSKHHDTKCQEVKKQIL